MPKKIEDIIMPDKRRSIRDIPIPEGRRKNDRSSRPASTAVHTSSKKDAAMPVHIEVREEEPAEPQSRNPDFPRHKRGSHKKTWAVMGVGTLLLVFAVLSLFNGATLAYVPKSAMLSFDNEVYTAHKSGTSGLFYSVVKLSRDKGQVAPASIEQDVSRKASGVIVVYNDASTESQKLIENTRFESVSGKIYRIQNAITIPGKKTVNGVSTPGTLEVTVYADQPGEAYNAELTDFTVPGLKGTSRYSSIYARSKTPMTGGFVGREKTVKEEDLARTKSELQEILKNELWAEVQAEVPQDFILFPALSSFTFEDLPQTAASDSGQSVTVNSRGHLYGIMFKKSDLSAYLADKKLELKEGDLVQIPSLDALQISFAGAPPADLLPLNEISFKIAGTTTVLWVTDEVALKADLVGRNKQDVPGILNNYPTVASASVTVRPFWKSGLPQESEKISIKRMSVQ